MAYQRVTPSGDFWIEMPGADQRSPPVIGKYHVKADRSGGNNIDLAGADLDPSARLLARRG